jgi:hypothetical protein
MKMIKAKKTEKDKKRVKNTGKRKRFFCHQNSISRDTENQNRILVS